MSGRGDFYYTRKTRTAALVDVTARTAEEAVDLAYDGDPSIKWKECGVVEFDARYVVVLDANGDEIEEYSRGKG